MSGEDGCTLPVVSLRMGDKFYVEPAEPADAAPIAVRVTGLHSWGLVHGWFDLPCQRLDNDEYVMVGLHHEAFVRPIAEAASA